jgi:hypothetical protein
MIRHPFATYVYFTGLLRTLQAIAIAQPEGSALILSAELDEKEKAVA